MLDFNTLDTKSAAERGLVVELEDPRNESAPFVDDDGKPFSITILGGDAGKIREKTRKQLDSYLTKARKNKEADSRAAEAEHIDKLAAATIAWHLPTLDGETLPAPNEHVARKLYSDPRFPWIVEQLTRAMNDRGRFFSTSSTS